MMPKTPCLTLPLAPGSWDTQADPATWIWDDIPTLLPFTLANGTSPAEQQTIVRVCYNSQAFYVRYDCNDRDIWGTYTQRDEPVYEEEVVELFLAPGEADPIRYYEFEVTPNGVLLDAQIYNPTSQRIELEVRTEWDCPGLHWQAGRNDAGHHWWVVMVVPWAAVAPPDNLPNCWRANFYRIERPRQADPEFSCWSPTLTEPADFHKPAYFGTLILNGEYR